MLTEAESRRRLEPAYMGIFCAMGIPKSEAKVMFDGLFERASQISKQKNLADVDAEKLLAVARERPVIAAELEWKRDEGVREEDFRWWWNTPDVERQVMLQSHEHFRLTQFVTLRESGVSVEEAAHRVRVCHPIFVEFSFWDNTSPRDQHSSLPVELTERVLKHSENHRAIDPSGEAWRRVCTQAGSANAAIREEIRTAKL
jgi:hypothetical protein